jgi:NADH:ubiquinone oxidoreductase subunit K
LLTFAAIEAALGLALLVNFLRSYGNDFCINISQFFAKN